MNEGVDDVMCNGLFPVFGSLLLRSDRLGIGRPNTLDAIGDAYEPIFVVSCYLYNR